MLHRWAPQLSAERRQKKGRLRIAYTSAEKVADPWSLIAHSDGKVKSLGKRLQVPMLAPRGVQRKGFQVTVNSIR